MNAVNTTFCRHFSFPPSSDKVTERDIKETPVTIPNTPLGFLSFTLDGALLLMLPIPTINGITFADALFTSTSAICVTGLIVNNTPVDFTLFGLLVIMVLIGSNSALGKFEGMKAD